MTYLKVFFFVFTVPAPSISGLLDIFPTMKGVELSWKAPKSIPSGYVVEIMSDDDKFRRWREISRLPGSDGNLPLSSFVIRSLDADKTYKFRVTPYRDDLYGKPVESLIPYRAPKLEELEYDIVQRPKAVPPPRGPLVLESLRTGQFQLRWRSPVIDSNLPTPGRIEYVLEQRLSGRRQWYEIARTPLLSHVLDVDTTSQFRVKSVIKDTTSMPAVRGHDYFIGSDDGPQSEWIHIDEKLAKPHPERFSPSRTEDVVTMPTRLYSRHVGPSSVLLEWEFKDRPETLGLMFLEKRLRPDSHLDFAEPIWEPVARIPLSSTKLSYEVTDLLPGRTYDFRLIEKPRFYGAPALQPLREVRLPEAIRTRGGEFLRSSHPRDTDYLLAPRTFTASFNPAPLGGLRFSWMPPESLERQSSKIKYRIESRSIYEPSSKWRTLAQDLKETEYTIQIKDLEKLVSSERLGRRGSKTEANDWDFRVISTINGVDSRPTNLPHPVSIVPESRKCFFNFRSNW